MAVDHFEHSNNQLNFLEHVAIDYINLHGSMTHEVDSDVGKRRKVQEVTASARSNGIRVIAGQVERPSELATLTVLASTMSRTFRWLHRTTGSNRFPAQYWSEKAFMFTSLA